MKKLLIYLLDLCAYLYSQLIIFNLYLLRFNSKKCYYNHSLAYGDSLCYYLHNYREIISNKKNEYKPIGLHSCKFFFTVRRLNDFD